jgi:hypothetical protein
MKKAPTTTGAGPRSRARQCDAPPHSLHCTQNLSKPVFRLIFATIITESRLALSAAAACRRVRCSLERLGLGGGWGDDGLDVASVAANGAAAVSTSRQVCACACVFVYYGAAGAPDAEGLPSGVVPEHYAAWQG